MSELTLKQRERIDRINAYWQCKRQTPQLKREANTILLGFSLSVLFLILATLVAMSL